MLPTHKPMSALMVHTLTHPPRIPSAPSSFLLPFSYRRPTTTSIIPWCLLPRRLPRAVIRNRRLPQQPDHRLRVKHGRRIRLGARDDAEQERDVSRDHERRRPVGLPLLHTTMRLLHPLLLVQSAARSSLQGGLATSQLSRPARLGVRFLPAQWPLWRMREVRVCWSRTDLWSQLRTRAELPRLLWAGTLWPGEWLFDGLHDKFRTHLRHWRDDGPDDSGIKSFS